MLRLFAFSAVTASLAQGSVTLSWNNSAAPGISGYRLYCGQASGDYSQVLEVGNATIGTISGLIVGATYYFAVTAYDGAGLESPFSSEISYVIPPPSLTWQLNVMAGQIAMLSGTAPAGRQYNVLAASDLRNWSIIGNIVVDASGSFRFTDSAPATSVAKYYRLQQTQP